MLYSLVKDAKQKARSAFIQGLVDRYKPSHLTFPAYRDSLQCSVTLDVILKLIEAGIIDIDKILFEEVK